MGALGASWGGLGASWYVLGASWGVLWAFWGRLGSPLGRLEGKKVANMAPTWLPKRSQNPSKIEAKTDQSLNASWDRIFEGCWWILEAKWSQVGTQMASKIDPNFERRFFEKSSFSIGKTMVLKDLGGRSWHQKSIENQPKKELNLGRPLGIHFSCILVDLGGQDGAMLAQKSIKNRSQEASKNRCKRVALLEPSWAALGRLLGLLGSRHRRGGMKAETPSQAL